MPSTRSGLVAADAMRATDRLLVLVASSVFGRGGGVQQPKGLPLELEVLGDRLHHQLGVGQRSMDRHPRADAHQRGVALSGRQLLLLDAPGQEASDPLPRPLHCAGQRVVQQNLDARVAATWAMPAPIVPAPSTPRRVILLPPSAANEARLPLLREGGHALGVVVGAAGQVLQLRPPAQGCRRGWRPRPS